jgi:hypothetical protein
LAERWGGMRRQKFLIVYLRAMLELNGGNWRRRYVFSSLIVKKNGILQIENHIFSLTE